MKRKKKKKAKEDIIIIPDIIIYTDGACNNFSPFGEGGSSYVILMRDKQIEKSGSKQLLNTTNNRAELHGILSGLYNAPDDSIILICSDSRYAINVLDGTYPNAEKNRDLIDLCLSEIRKKKQVYFEWVKGHNGNKYNELADSLANDKMLEVKDKFKIPTFGYKEYKQPMSEQLRRRVTRFFGWTETNAFSEYSDCVPF